MNIHTRKKLVPILGGVTAAATAAGGVAIAHVAPAGAEPASASSAMGVNNVVGAGMLESCSPYFGYGKSDGMVGLVGFDVADVNGDDGVDHGVDLDGDGDTDVVLVIETEENGTVECEPFEVTQEMWDDEWAGESGEFPAYPGPGHYVFPSVALQAETEELGTVVSVGFRVTGIPGEHTLVSPTDVKQLVDQFLDPDALLFGELDDPRVTQYLESEVGTTVADAYNAARDACIGEASIDGTDPDLLAGAAALFDLVEPDFEPTEVSCFEVQALYAVASVQLGLFDTVDYVEEIRLSTPEAPTTTVDPTTSTSTPGTTPAAAPAAQAIRANPNFTG